MSSPSASATATPAPVATVTPVVETAAVPPALGSAPGAEERLGGSVEGRAITIRSFGSGDRAVLYVGNIHGDEHGTAVARAFVDHLLDETDEVPAGARIDVIECLNPDGMAADTRGNARKVDLNRNMPSANWSAELDPRDASYARKCNGGASAGSEPETQALLKALGRGYDAVVMLHSSGGIVDFDGPGGEELARRMSEACGLPVSHLGYQAYIRGSVGQFVPERYSIPVITLELESGELSSGLRDALLEAASAE